MGKSLIIKGADFSVNGIVANLDSVVYEGLSYKDIFETNNLLGISVGFEDGTYNGLKVVTGTPAITSSISDTGKYALQCSGSTSCQLNRTAGALDAGNYFAAARVNCVRYTTGAAGLVFGSDMSDCIRSVTDGFVTVTTSVISEARVGLFIGSFDSADLDCYVDTPVCIDMSIFNVKPSDDVLTSLYNAYIGIKKR